MEREVRVNHAEGLHARPAADIMKLAGQYQSRLSVVHGGKSANAKSMVSLLRLGVQQGQSVVVRAEGPDEEEALTALADFLEDAARSL
ncbi:phosphocarrier protein [Paenibacillus sp. UNCCL117]|uniref:HPr family phosphocarrier protein n=1 Tax=unclassified Paenibacillus TaxID=185978 RepID=UPI00088D9F5B|nr:MULTISPECIES: HPr family phosphocarrier protein [unclassified Paenibacillus]SDD32468.1 phosphocarrier protein [Paenibacillus sp. cl123]SFW39821.1 phosphocarrier protein [Paenibacillus sp. UNCCL117]